MKLGGRVSLNLIPSIRGKKKKEGKKSEASVEKKYWFVCLLACLFWVLRIESRALCHAKYKLCLQATPPTLVWFLIQDRLKNICVPFRIFGQNKKQIFHCKYAHMLKAFLCLLGTFNDFLKINSGVCQLKFPTIFH